MDVSKVIRDLVLKRELIDRAISELEGLQTPATNADGSPMPKRRGRKGMGPEERREVSERMKRYWANRGAKSALNGLSGTLSPE